MNLQVNLEILNEFPSEFEKKWIQGEILNEFPSEFEKKWIQGEILNGFLSEFGKKWIQRKWTNFLVNSNSLLYPLCARNARPLVLSVWPFVFFRTFLS